MIHACLIFNTSGKARLTKFYSASSPQSRADVLQTIFALVNARDDTLCNFADLPAAQSCFGEPDEPVEGLRVIYRRFATLCFCLVVDDSESELAILDLIQVFVESLDRCFENVCELDLIFHFDEVHTLLNCLITGGLVLDTSVDSIQQSFSAQMKARKASSTPALSLSSIPAAEQAWDRFGLGAFTGRR